MRQPGIEPGASAWEADMLTITPLSHSMNTLKKNRGRAGIEPATSCTQSRNHTTRPTTQIVYIYSIILKIRTPRIELGTYCVLGSRHNQLDQVRFI